MQGLGFFLSPPPPPPIKEKEKSFLNPVASYVSRNTLADSFPVTQLFILTAWGFPFMTLETGSPSVAQLALNL